MLVVDFQHVKPGKGAAFVRTKYKNVITGAVREEAFNPSAKFEQVAVERKNAEYSYNDGDLYYFMDPETYDMVPLNSATHCDLTRFLSIFCPMHSNSPRSGALYGWRYTSSIKRTIMCSSALLSVIRALV